MQERPKVGLGVCIVKEGKVLFGKRKNIHGHGSRGWTGGHLEFGETREACAKRETLEEANIIIDNIQLLHVTNDIFENENKHYITILLKADYVSGEVKVTEPDKLVTRQRYDRKNIPSPLMIPIQNMINDGISPFDE